MQHVLDALWNYFGFGDGRVSVTLAIWMVYAGVVLGCFIMIRQKRIVGRFVRSLLDANASSPESALTLSQLGYKKSSSIKRYLRGKTILSGMVYEASETDESGNFSTTIRSRVNFETGRFYIPEEKNAGATVRFGTHDGHLKWFVVAAVVFFIIAAIAGQILPGLIQAFDGNIPFGGSR